MKYSRQKRMLAAVDCIIFGFDEEGLKILLVQRPLKPEQGRWSLMGGFVNPQESFEDASQRVLKMLTGLEGVYMEQLYAFGEPDRDPIERTLSVAYYALIDIHKYENQLSHAYHAEWFPARKIPQLIFDHNAMVEMAKRKLRYKAALHPLVFELLPAKFTIPQLQTLYEELYETTFDKRNFSRKVLSTGLLVKQQDKEKTSSKRGAYYYKLDKKKYKSDFQAFLNLIPHAHLIM